MPTPRSASEFQRMSEAMAAQMDEYISARPYGTFFHTPPPPPKKEKVDGRLVPVGDLTFDQPGIAHLPERQRLLP